MKQNQIAKYKKYIAPNNYILSQIQKPHKVKRAISKYSLSASCAQKQCALRAANVQANPEESQDLINAG